jgi:membrane-associated phospholipid phosphatase
MNMRFRTRSIAVLFAAALAASSAAAQSLTISVDPLFDGIALGGLALGALGSEFIPNLIGDTGYVKPSLDLIPAWERAAMKPYSKNLDSAAAYAVAGCLILPVLPAFVGDGEISLARPLGAAQSLPDWLEVSAMYGESLAAAYLIKNVLKSFIPRARPYLYDEKAPAELASDPDSIRSFPSGHATLAFTAASFASTMFILRDPGSPWIIPWTAVCLGAASAVAFMRVESGAHFLGDALAGAGIGILAGAVSPLIHSRIDSAAGASGAATSRCPIVFVMSYRY